MTRNLKGCMCFNFVLFYILSFKCFGFQQGNLNICLSLVPEKDLTLFSNWKLLGVRDPPQD